MTYTIVARDPETGQFGVAVQTYNLGVASWVPWAVGGIGAVATQALAERSYGTLGLDLMRGGKTSHDALRALVAIDELADVRQVGMIDKHGNVAVHTGSRCFPENGSYIGNQYCTLANMMLKNTVWTAMATAYENAEGDFADRLLAALHAAQAEGGDLRGKQTAAILIVDSEPNPIPILDLHVEHDPNPVEKLAQIVSLSRAYVAEYRVSGLIDDGNLEEAQQILNQIAQTAPQEHYLTYLRALHRARLGDWEQALSIINTLIAEIPIWEEYLRREAKTNNFGVPDLGKQLLERIDPKRD